MDAWLPAGTYEVFASPTLRYQGRRGGWSRIHDDLSLSRDRRLRLKLRTRVPSGHRVHGRVTIAGRPPSAHLPEEALASVSIRANGLADPGVIRDEATMAPDGRFELSLPRGEHRVVLYIPRQCATADGTPGLPFLNSEVVLDPSLNIDGPTRRDLDVRRTRLDARVSIRGPSAAPAVSSALDVTLDQRATAGTGPSPCIPSFSFNTRRRQTPAGTRLSAPALDGCYAVTLNSPSEFGLRGTHYMASGGDRTLRLPLRPFHITMTWDGRPWSREPYGTRAGDTPPPVLELKSTWMRRRLPIPTDGRIETWVIGDPDVYFVGRGHRYTDQRVRQRPCPWELGE